LQGDFHHYIVLFFFKINRFRVERRLVGVQRISRKRRYAFVMKIMRFIIALIGDIDMGAGVQEGEFAQTVGERVERIGFIGQKFLRPA